MTTIPAAAQANAPLAYKIAVLVFVQNTSGEHLLLLRAKAPNAGTWSPIGGKLETSTGESPFECAVRETLEETGHKITVADLHLFAMIAEKAYEGASHWLLFLFQCTRPLDTLPVDIEEGRFGFFRERPSKDWLCQKPIAPPCGRFTTGTTNSLWPCGQTVRRVNRWKS